jgi:hypothetical protein
LRGSPQKLSVPGGRATLNDFPAIRDGCVKRDIIPDDAPSSARSLADADIWLSLSSATIASRLILMDDAAHAVPPT